MDKVLDDSTREAIALKRFSLISPVLNGQVDNQRIYFGELSQKAHEMPYYGPRKYAAKTIRKWYSEYMRCGLEALKPGYRKDKGRRRKIDEPTAEMIRKKREENPRVPVSVLYELMTGKGEIDGRRVSVQTFYRFLQDEAIHTKVSQTDKEAPEMLRYSYEDVNICWQVDALYGPYIHDGRCRRQTFLIAFIDDASRIIPYSRFYWTQRYEDLRDAFKEAVLRRGVPKLVYADNGKIFRTQQFEYICASIGTSLVHSQPFVPNQRGKIERYFKTVRERFLSRLDLNSLKSLDDLNERYSQWLEEDYHRKVHSGIGTSPLEYFLKQVSKVRMISDPAWITEAFLMRTTRKVNHDATIQVGKMLYETDQRLSGLRVEVRFDPSWLANPSQPLILFIDGKKVGEARYINFRDNAYVRRKRSNRLEPRDECGVDQKDEMASESLGYSPSIRFSDMMDRRDE